MIPALQMRMLSVGDAVRKEAAAAWIEAKESRDRAMMRTGRDGSVVRDAAVYAPLAASRAVIKICAPVS